MKKTNMKAKTIIQQENVIPLQRAAIYCRVSTEREIQQGSFELQKLHFTELIAENPVQTLVGVYGDFGKSGRSMRKREDFRRMIADCEQGKIDIIYTKSISRFARNFVDCMETLEKLKTLGVTVIFEENGIDTSQNKSELLIGILASVAAEESNSYSANQIWAIDEKNARGEPISRPPYGFHRKKRETAWYVVPVQAAQVKLAFELASSGHTLDVIVTMLQKAEQEGIRWNTGRVRRMLKNIAYFGDYLTTQHIKVAGKSIKNNGSRPQYYLEGHHPALVSKVMYDRVQELLRVNLIMAGRCRYSRAERVIIEDDSWKEADAAWKRVHGCWEERI